MAASEVQKNLDNHTQTIEELEKTLVILEQLDKMPEDDALDHQRVLERLTFLVRWDQSIQELTALGEKLPATPEKSSFINFCNSSQLDNSLITLPTAVAGICTLLKVSVIISVWVALAAFLVRIIASLSVQINEWKQQDKEFLKQRINLLIGDLNKERIKMPSSPITTREDARTYLVTTAAMKDILENNHLEETIQELKSSLQQEKIEKEEIKSKYTNLERQMQVLLENQAQNQILLKQILNITANTSASSDLPSINSPPTDLSNTTLPQSNQDQPDQTA